MAAESSTLQGILSQQRPPLAGVHLVPSSLLGLLFNHVAPGGPQSLGQRRTDPRETSDGDGRMEAMDGSVVTGQSGGGEDLHKEEDDSFFI